VASNGNIADPLSIRLYEKILEGSKWEYSKKLDVSFWGMIKDPVARRRLLIGASVGPFASIAGNIIATFYLGSELKTAGITDTVAQLKAVEEPLLPSYNMNV
jgi:hypothetical protein